MRGRCFAILGFAIVALGAACSHPAPAPTTGGSGGSAVAVGPQLVTDEASATANAGKRAGVKGTARNAKLGGVIQTESLVVYCLGVTEWPSDVDGKEITAYGTLQSSHQFEAKPGPKGEQAAGTSGPVWVLENCQYDK